jgi:hypothetical protein
MGEITIARGSAAARRLHGRASPWIPLVLLVVLTPAAAIGAPATTTTSTSRAKGHAAATTKAKGKATAKVTTAKVTTAKAAKAKSGTRTTAVSARPKGKGHVARSAAPSAPVVPPRATGKVAVFGFDGDGAVPLQARVIRLLRSRGLKVITNLRPFDSPEQYRETADALGLAAFMDGEASEDGDQASVTVHVRSGVSGLRVASATLSGERRKLAGEVDRSLWAQLGTPLARVCDDASKPRKHEREPMRIEAGTPLDSHPPDHKDGGKDDRKEDHDPKARAPSAG